MASKMNVAYVEKCSAEGHLIDIRSEEIITPGMVDSNGKMKCMVNQSSSPNGGIRIAINHVYILVRSQITETTRRELPTFIVGMERTLIAEKHMLGIKISGKKNLLASRHMRSLRRHYLKADKRGIFSHIYSYF